MVMYSICSYKRTTSALGPFLGRFHPSKPGFLFFRALFASFPIPTGCCLLFHPSKDTIIIVFAAGARVHVEVVITRISALIHLHVC